MSEITLKQQIEKLLEENEVFEEIFKDGSVGYEETRQPKKDGDFVEIDGLMVRQVDSEGGREGEGDSVSRVLEVQTCQGSRFFKLCGFYSSWDGTDWENDVKEVKPEQVTITVYKEIK